MVIGFSAGSDRRRRVAFWPIFRMVFVWYGLKKIGIGLPLWFATFRGGDNALLGCGKKQGQGYSFFRDRPKFGL
jgi:hypothetical protein